MNVTTKKQYSPNDFVVHGFRQSVYDVEEGNRLDTEFALNVVGTTQLPALDISGTITAEAHGTSSRQDKNIHFVFYL